MRSIWKYAISYKIEIIDTKGPLAQFGPIKWSIEYLLENLLDIKLENSD